VCGGDPQVDSQSGPAGPLVALTIENGILYFSADAAIWAYVIATGNISDLRNGEGGSGSLDARAPYLGWCEPSGDLIRMLRDGGEYTDLSGIGCGCQALTADYIYFWADGPEMPYRVPFDGGAAETFYPINNGYRGCVRANDSVAAVAIDREIIFHDLTSLVATQLMTSDLIIPHEFILTASAVYFLTGPDGGTTLLRGDAGSNWAVPLVAHRGMSHLFADEGGAYWVEPDNFVHGCSDPHCSGGSHRYAAVDAGEVVALALDPGWIYVALTSRMGSIKRWPR
jgi:hypothetical protein